MHDSASLLRLGVDMTDWDYVIALAGNPNTGKSTVFNAVTGLRQHTGNWPGKTVSRAEGGFMYGDQRYKIVDLPGTYSLLATSLDEEIARDFVLFGKPDVTVIVVDATRLERNLNLVLQVLEITDRVVVCLNLMDEARRHGLQVDDRRLARDLGVPIVPTAARQGEGLKALLKAIADVATGQTVCRPHRLSSEPPRLRHAVAQLTTAIQTAYPNLPNARWLAFRLLDGDQRIAEAIQAGEFTEGEAEEAAQGPPADAILELAQSLRWDVGQDFREHLVEAIYTDAARLADRAITLPDKKPRFDLDRTIDRVVTSRRWGIPIMLALLALVFWLTIAGANVPSAALDSLLIGSVHPLLKDFAARIGMPWWLDGLLIDGIYLATAWVIAVMLPPMAIFFPLFTLLEDLGYLPRVAFNLDSAYKRVGAHGKQALSMTMGFGCNAAGVIATRIIDSPRERLIAIITNNFSLCNGRWPTQILIATIFIGSLAPPYLAGLISALSVIAVAVLGIVLSLVVSWGLSRTWLRGEVSTFSLELPPYRPPRVLQTIYTSLIDRTIFVLWRAVVFAMPAGAVIWLSANLTIDGVSIAEHLINLLNPFGLLLGLNGVILVAYIVAIPANEIVIPTILMLTVLFTGANMGAGTGVMFELESASDTYALLQAGGWTLLTAINLMLFSLLHNPCSTTIYTIYKETGSARWATVSALLPLGMGFLLTFTITQVARLFGLA
ncbi:MAG: ferrous iron transport protein B [Anaerolineae bacterium]|nr:ferrous iron transport protein B [Anaerolineae bacterium]